MHARIQTPLGLSALRLLWKLLAQLPINRDSRAACMKVPVAACVLQPSASAMAHPHIRPDRHRGLQAAADIGPAESCAWKVALC